jgi:hypothetical protein
MSSPDVKEKLQLSNIGRTHTTISKEKIGLAEIGNRKAIGHTYVPTAEAIKKQRVAILGGRNPNWRGGLSNMPWPLEFNEELKEQIRERDRFSCQLCGVPQCECIRKLDVHHIDYDKANLWRGNLISLCVRCNSKVNFNRTYWINYFRELLS